MTTGKTIALTIWNFFGKVMSLLFNTLSRFVIAFLPKSKHLLILWLYSLFSDIRAQENETCNCFHFFPFYLLWSDRTGCHDLSFLNVSFKPAFSLSSFTFIKRLVSSSLLSAIIVVSSAYLRLLLYDLHYMQQGKLSFSSSRASLVAQLVKKSACNVGDLGSILGLGRSPAEGKGYALQ